MTACDYCESVEECAAWCEDGTKKKPVGARDFSGSNEYKLYLKAREVVKRRATPRSPTESKDRN